MYALPPPSLPLTTAHLHPSMARGRRPLPQAFRSAVIRALRQVFTHLLSQRRPNSSSRLRSYKLDGPGVVYIVGRVRTTVYNSYIAKQMSRDDFLDALEVKVGHSKNFKARRRAYKRCAGEHTLFWHATYTTRHRMLLESMVHQRLKNIGAALRSVSCACKTQHREFSSFVRAGGFPGVDDIVEKCLGALGETNLVRSGRMDSRFFPRPVYYTALVEVETIGLELQTRLLRERLYVKGKHKEVGDA
ncbi:hypothetical protein B0H11DRAFT_1935836 [Mycena galericulata]|nr:hypothetical protein B0H11DRAFT_1940396 [Mycena galericulata]KAJ7437630.1 hypothetical protein B0H11DRAFT_1935836 [Mycena galericulata]